MESPLIKTAVVGLGRWGKIVAQELRAASDLVGYAASDEAWAAEHIPSARRMTLREICDSADIQAVWVATPIHTHLDIARQLIEAGKHVMVEKPTSTDSDSAARLAQEAAARRTTLATGYVFLYHPAYVEARRIAKEKRITRIACVWKKYGTFAEPIEHNLLTHHLSLALELLGKPLSGTLHLGVGVQSACDELKAQLAYDGCVFTSSINRAHEGEASHSMTLFYEGGAQEVIFGKTAEPLRREIADFMESVRTGTLPQNGGDFGAQVLKLHEMLDPSR